LASPLAEGRGGGKGLDAYLGDVLDVLRRRKT
jgi:hypothetical protein